MTDLIDKLDALVAALNKTARTARERDTQLVALAVLVRDSWPQLKEMARADARLKHQHSRYCRNVADADLGGLMSYETWLAAIDAAIAKEKP